MKTQGKTVWITGASSGIGEALAYEFAKEKANIVISARREDELLRVQKNCLQYSDNCMILPLDLSQSSGFSTLVKKVIDKFGQIDFLINNGGISQRSLVEDTDISIDRKVFEVNFFGTIAFTKAVLPYMLDKKNGHISVVSSLTGKFGFPLRSAYSASKHALQGYFETLRAETSGRGIKTCIIIPGRIKTNVSINAITANGKIHNKMDEGQSKAMLPEKAAKKIIRAIKNGKREVLVGGSDVLLAYIRRFIPSLYYYIVTKVKAE